MSDEKKTNAPGSINRRDLLKAAMVAPTAALVRLAREWRLQPPPARPMRLDTRRKSSTLTSGKHFMCSAISSFPPTGRAGAPRRPESRNTSMMR